ncbi:MAG: hypothetical protein QXK37_02175 [Candidatus Woesearchaeota archaeon]
MEVKYNITFNEVMYNPSGDDATGEFIELLMIGPDIWTLNLENWTISDGVENDTLTYYYSLFNKEICSVADRYADETKETNEEGNLSFLAFTNHTNTSEVNKSCDLSCSYAIITGKDVYFDIGGLTIKTDIVHNSNLDNYFNKTNEARGCAGYSIYTVDTKIGNGLNNEGDSLILFDADGKLIVATEYKNIAEEGKSIELLNESWHESLVYGGTPGRQNSVSYVFEKEKQNTNLSINVDVSNEQKQKNSVESALETDEEIKKIDNPENLTENEELKNHEITEACNISIWTEKDIFEVGEQIAFYMVLPNKTKHTKGFVIKYWIEDVSGNIVKESIETTNTNKKTWTPRKNNQQANIIKANLRVNNCVASTQKLIAINTTPQNEEVCKKEAIARNEENTYINFVSITRTGTLTAEISRGKSTKSVVDILIEQEGAQPERIFKVALPYKNTVAKITLPLDVSGLCGTIIVTAEGFGLRESTMLKLDDCKKDDTTKKDLVYEAKKNSSYDAHGHINSFYTLSRKFNKTINIFANIETEYDGIAVIESETEINYFNISKGKQTLKIPVNATIGKNVFAISLIYNDTIVDNRVLEFNLSDNTDNSGVLAVVPNKKTINPGSVAMPTASVVQVYESKNEITKRYLKYPVVLLVIFALLIIFTYFIKKKS